MSERLELALRLRPQVCRYVSRLINNYEDAEDAVQETYLKLWTKIDAPNLSIDTEAEMISYLTVAVRNNLYSMLRKRKCRPKSVSMTEELYDTDWFEKIPDALIDYETPEAIVLESEHHERVNAAFSAGIAALSPTHRALMNAVVSGETPTEYARRNGEPAGTVTFRSWWARQQIKKTLETLPFTQD